MAREVSKEEADELLAESRHAELVNHLKVLVQEIKKGQDNSGVIAAINKQIAAIEAAMSKITQDPEQPVVNVAAPNVAVTTNQDQVIAAIADMKKEICADLSSLRTAIENIPRKWTYDVTKRDYGGWIQQAVGNGTAN